MLPSAAQTEDDSVAADLNQLSPTSEVASPGLKSSVATSCARRIPRLFLLLAAPLVLLYVFIVPPFQVPDEDEHMVRAYGVSESNFIAKERTLIPVSFLNLAERFCPFPSHVPQGHVLRFAELGYWLKQPLKESAVAAPSNPAADVYSFVPYLPASAVFRAGRLLDASPLSQVYAARLLNGVIYVWLVFWALSILPEFQLLSLTIALTPMALTEAASLSADSVTLALTALLTAWIFKLAWDKNLVSFEWRQQVVLGLLFVLVALCKFYPWTALLVFLIPGEKFGSKTRAAGFKVACLFAVCVTGLGWQLANHSAVVAFGASQTAKGYLTARNTAFLLDHPFRFAEVVFWTNLASLQMWVSEFVGILGWLTVPLNRLFVIAYLGCILMAARMRTRDVAVSSLQKAVLLSFVLLTILYLHVTLWIFCADTKQFQSAVNGASAIYGIQGRYFLPIALPALILISSRPFWLRARILWGIVSVILMVHIAALMTVWRFFS